MIFYYSFAVGNWNPYAEIERLQRNMDRIFNNAFNGVVSGPFSRSIFFITLQLCHR